MKNKIMGVILVVLFVALGSTSAIAQQDRYLSKDDASAALEQSIKAFDNQDLKSLPVDKQLEYDFLVKLQAIIDENGMEPEQAVDYFTDRLKKRGFDSPKALSAMEKVKGVLTD